MRHRAPGIALALSMASALVLSASIVPAPAAASLLAGTSPLDRKEHPFPSSSSSVTGSVGFIDDEQCGYFALMSRGDMVEEVFDAPPSKLKWVGLKLDVTANTLVTGSEVHWRLIINNRTVGDFVISSGQLGQDKERFFVLPKLHGQTYAVKLVVTNNVPRRDGSIALRYAGDGWHSIGLNPR